MAYTTIDKPSDYFDTKLHTGTGGSKTLAYDFEVDFYWTKLRNDAYPHDLFDSSRGNNALLRANQTNSEVGAANTVSFGNASGVTLGSDSSSYGVNQANTDGGSSATFVGWAWKANGGTTSSNSDGSLASTVQANTTAGFSIVTWTADGGGAKTIGHGLGAVPKMIITKNRTDASTNWQIYHASNTSAPETEVIYFTNGATQDYDGFMADTAPTSSVFTAGGDGSMNGTSGKNIIAYCFAEIQGYSKIGGYTGNGNADGAFVHTGFRPAWIMGKRSSGAHGWFLFDDVRDTFNPTNQLLEPHLSNAESNDSFDIDILSNGFKLRGSENTINGNGETYIYMAFARHPFVSSKGIPVTAR